MSKISFPAVIKMSMSDAVPCELKWGCWTNGKTYPHIYIDEIHNSIDGKWVKECDVKGNLCGAGKEIKYQGASHMNSSQVMCINFFKKFFEKEEWEEYLLRALAELGVPVELRRIAKASFEYEPCHEEKTNFDFYMIMDDESKISIEVKYTESEFGRISYDKDDPNKYDRKWENVYKKMVKNSQYLAGISKEEFYDNYQINRNISYAQNNDIVLFLTPLQNDAKKLCDGRAYIDGFENRNICNIDWTELTNVLLKLVKDEPELLDYYRKFWKKYISIL